MMVTPLAFEENLIRIVNRDGEPWFVGVDVCRALGLSKPENALTNLDDDEKYTLTEGVINDIRGPNARLIISEPGVYRLVFRSRKPQAERFKRWLAHEVLPEIRKTGSYKPDASGIDPVSGHANPNDPLIQRLQVIREARMLFGRARAASLWRTLELPAVPPPPPAPIDEAHICLRHLLDATIANDARRVRDLIEEALNDGETAAIDLKTFGIRVQPETDGFVVANRLPELAELFKRTEWTAGRHMRVLRRLPGTSAAPTARYRTRVDRGTWIPALYLDEEYNPKGN